MHDVMQESKAGETFFQQMAGDQPLAITAFKGYVKHFDNARQGVLNKGSTGIRWAEQLLQGNRQLAHRRGPILRRQGACAALLGDPAKARAKLLAAVDYSAYIECLLPLRSRGSNE